MKEFCSLFQKELEEFLLSAKEPSYRSTQLLEWVYQKGEIDWEKMTNLSKPLRTKLKEAFIFPTLQLEKMQTSEDGETFKFLFKLKDQNFVEAVLICSGDRRTICLSSQVGCPARCSFCASGKEGLLRNLSAGEIVEQVLHIKRFLMEKKERVSHLVFMGMGEPLENYDALVHAIKMFMDPKFFGISQRRITVSTVGVVEGIKKLKKENFTVNLALSLHAPNQHIRKKIIPYARKYPLEKIIEVVREYGKETKRDITYEYILLSGINDGEEEARGLALLLKHEQCTVNLIPYNPVPFIHLKRPQKEAIENFQKTLFGLGIRCTRRYTKGKDIAAACGQLALQKKGST